MGGRVWCRDVRVGLELLSRGDLALSIGTCAPTGVRIVGTRVPHVRRGVSFYAMRAMRAMRGRRGMLSPPRSAGTTMTANAAAETGHALSLAEPRNIREPKDRRAHVAAHAPVLVCSADIVHVRSDCSALLIRVNGRSEPSVTPVVLDRDEAGGRPRRLRQSRVIRRIC